LLMGIYTLLLEAMVGTVLLEHTQLVLTVTQIISEILCSKSNRILVAIWIGTAFQ
jgi:hypothetical protein